MVAMVVTGAGTVVVEIDEGALIAAGTMEAE